MKSRGGVWIRSKTYPVECDGKGKGCIPGCHEDWVKGRYRFRMNVNSPGRIAAIVCGNATICVLGTAMLERSGTKIFTLMLPGAFSCGVPMIESRDPEEYPSTA